MLKVKYRVRQTFLRIKRYNHPKFGFYKKGNMMGLYKNSLHIIFLSISISLLFQGCFASNQNTFALDQAEEKKLAKEKIHEKIEKKFPINYALAKKSGYTGYTEYKSIEKFTGEYEYGHIDINDYIGYVILNKSTGTYAYKFLKMVDNIEIYQPDSRYGWVLTVGVKRDNRQMDLPPLGSPLLNVGTVSFLGGSNYKTRYGVYKKILVFDRAKKFREVSATVMLEDTQRK